MNSYIIQNRYAVFSADMTKVLCGFKFIDINNMNSCNIKLFMSNSEALNYIKQRYPENINISIKKIEVTYQYEN